MCHQRDVPVSENNPFDNNDNLAAFTREYPQTDTLAAICQ